MSSDEKNNLENTIKSLESSYHNLYHDWEGAIRTIEELRDEIKGLKKQNEIMKESLEFYANEDNWCYLDGDDVPGIIIDESDEESLDTKYKYTRGGSLARQALEKIK